MMSTVEHEKIICNACGDQIDASVFLAHLINHVSREFKNRFDIRTTDDDTCQIHDLIMSRYLDLKDFDLNVIIEDFRDIRIIKILEYQPLSIVLYYSDDEGYFMMMDMTQVTMGRNRDRAVRDMIITVNQHIERNLENDSYFTAQISGTPSSMCHQFSYHMKVSTMWLGVPVIIQKDDDGEKHHAKPVMCGNSVHVTVPKKWSNETVTVKLAKINSEEDLTEMDND